MADTLLLDRSSWDLCVDVSGSIALASEPYSQVQDVSSACRLFSGEAWFDTTKGIPYFGQILGKQPPLGLVKSKLIAAALSVPGVTAAKAFLTSDGKRGLSGQVQVTTSAGVQVAPL